MNPYKKAALLLLRLIATGMVLIGGLNVALELLRHRTEHTEIGVAKTILNAVVFLAGAILFFTSGKLADRIARRLDE